MKSLVESIVGNNSAGIRSLHPFLDKGKKQRLDWKDMYTEAYKFNGNSSRKTPEYLKFICNNFVDRVLWKYPDMIFSRSEVEDIEMGYSKKLSKVVTTWYKYKGKEIGFRCNTSFNDLFLTIKLKEGSESKDVTNKVLGGYIFETTVLDLFCDKKYVQKFKDYLDTL